MDCLIVSYSEQNRNRERRQFYDNESSSGSGWGRFLHLSYVDYDNDIILPNQLASLVEVESDNGKIEKTKAGHFKRSDLNIYSTFKVPMLGGLYLYQFLKALSFDVELIRHAQLEEEKFEKLLSQGPKVIAISTTLILNPLDIAEVVKTCREKSPDSFIVLGGMSTWNHYLSNKDDATIFQGYQADAVVLDGRGAKTLGVLVDHIVKGKSLTDVPNLVLYNGKNVDVTSKQPEDFDFKKDDINWDLIENDLLGQIAWVRTQISCPFACSFCTYPTTAGVVIKADMETLDRGLKQLQRKGVKYLLFIDDTFNVPPHRFKQILRLLKKYDFFWSSYIRSQYLDEEQVADMKESGCIGVFLGIESGNDNILGYMNKRVTTEKYRRGVGLLASQEIDTFASFIVGYPGETEASVEDTKRFIQTSGVSYYNVKIFYYEKSAPIHELRNEFQLRGHGMNWTHKTMTSSQAFEKTEELIRDIQGVPYIPQHSSDGVWESAYFRERGFGQAEIQMLYKNFNCMLQNELSSSPNRLTEQEGMFKELVSLRQQRNVS
jgi:p-methyltransferase